MHYYIDGYNLVFRLVHDDSDLQEQRHNIIVDLNRKISYLGLDATIVFDATHQIGDATRSHFKDLEIVYTAEGELADEYIIEELKSSPTPLQETVVTSDKKLAWLARRKSAKTESVEEFVAWLNHRYKNKIRHQKEKQKAPAHSPQQSAKTVLKKTVVKKPAKPSKQASVEECAAYYLDIFEKEYETIKDNASKMNDFNKPAKLTPQTEQTSTKKKRPKGAAKEPPSPLSEMERWLNIFQTPRDEE